MSPTCVYEKCGLPQNLLKSVFFANPNIAEHHRCFYLSRKENNRRHSFDLAPKSVSTKVFV